MGRSRNKKASSQAKLALNTRVETADDPNDRTVTKEDGSDDLQGQDTSTARNSSQASSSCGPYLTSSQLRQLGQDEKLILEMFPLLDKHVNIYITAGVLRQSMDAALMGEQLAKGMSQRLYRDSLKPCQKVDYESLYHKMNTGQPEALLQWQRFSVKCLQSAVMYHAAHNTPLPVKMDNDPSLPPAKRTAHDRARIKIVTPDMSTSKDDIDKLAKVCRQSRVTVIKEMPSGRRVVETRKPRQMSFPYPFSPDEFGPNDDFILDVSGLIPPKKFCIITNRKDMLDRFDFARQAETSMNGMTEVEFALLQTWFKQLQKECIDLDESKQGQDLSTFSCDCCMLAVFARLLYGTPLRIRNLEEYDKATRKEEAEEKKAGTSQPNANPQPTPVSAGTTAGYELRCTLNIGGPEHIVHVPLEAFKKDPCVILDMSELLGRPSTLPVLPHEIIDTVEEMSVDPLFTDPSIVQQLLNELKKRVRDPETLVTHMLAADEKGQKKLWDMCHSIVCLQHAKCNQHIRILCYPGIENTKTGCRKEVQKFVERAREECMKALTSKGVPFEM